jgi:hypothetical protein
MSSRRQALLLSRVPSSCSVLPRHLLGWLLQVLHQMLLFLEQLSSALKKSRTTTGFCARIWSAANHHHPYLVCAWYSDHLRNFKRAIAWCHGLNRREQAVLCKSLCKEQLVGLNFLWRSMCLGKTRRDDWVWEGGIVGLIIVCLDKTRAYEAHSSHISVSFEHVISFSVK